ncbi:MAG: aspartyl/asparaginyl beta-hydroxylase domain-containing protein, partial [Arenimonas sp.]
RLMRLSGQAEVTPHVDVNYYWRERVRVHVPIVTQPSVRFTCGDAEINMAAGECWIFDTWRLHRVVNDHSAARIHLVADTVGGRGFWPLLRQARPHDRAIPGWQPQHVAPDASAPTALEVETCNVPTVMSPWEVREHLGFLFGETPPSEALRALGQAVMGPFTREWHALWAKHGDGGGGFDEYRALRDQVRPHLARFEALSMRNGLSLVEGIRVVILGNLVAGSVDGDVETRDTPRANATAGAGP